MEITESKAFKIFVRLYFLFRSERINVNINLTLLTSKRDWPTDQSTVYRESAG
jgi:hypothetical protein